jgi:hypothetical protein
MTGEKQKNYGTARLSFWRKEVGIFPSKAVPHYQKFIIMQPFKHKIQPKCSYFLWLMRQGSSIFSTPCLCFLFRKEFRLRIQLLLHTKLCLLQALTGLVLFGVISLYVMEVIWNK